ncbi:MAG: nucleotidyltransferase family protein [Solirubrobacteraceae bacterium]
MSLGCLVLAAGAARRFGSPKQLALLDGRPLLAHVLALAAPWDPLVVLGAHADTIREHVDFGRHVVAGDWADGQSASLRAGVAALDDVDRVLVLLGDQPFLTRAVVEAVLAVDEGDAVRAAYSGVPGHPVVLGRRVLPAVGSLRGDTGARDLLGRFDVRLVEAGHLCDPADIDTPDQLEARREGVH